MTQKSPVGEASKLLWSTYMVEAGVWVNLKSVSIFDHVEKWSWCSNFGEKRFVVFKFVDILFCVDITLNFKTTITSNAFIWLNNKD